MVSKGKKITLFDASGMLTKEAVLGYVYNELTPEARQEVDRQLAENEMYRDMVEGFQQMTNRTEVEHIINELNIGVAERSGSVASVPGLGENMGEFFWNYRRVAAVVGGILLLSVGVLTFALWKVSNSDNSLALNKEVKETPIAADAGGKKQGETTGDLYTGTSTTPPSASDSTKIVAGLFKTEEDREDISADRQNPFTAAQQNELKNAVGNTDTKRVEIAASAGEVSPDNALNKRKEPAVVKSESITTVPVGSGSTTTQGQSTDTTLLNQNLARTDEETVNGYLSAKNNLELDKKTKFDDLEKKKAEERTVSSLDNTMMSNSVANTAGTPQSQLSYKGITLQVAQQMPAYPGGDAALTQYLHDNLRYPEKSKNEGVQGNVYVSFIIGTGGKVKEIAVIGGVNKEINNEAIRLIANMPKWEPGKMGNEPVSVQLYRTIEFKIEEEPAKGK